jgi:hypothetical protein
MTVSKGTRAALVALLVFAAGASGLAGGQARAADAPRHLI